MTTPASGVISIGNVRAEISASGVLSLSNSLVRSLAGSPGGAGIIRLSDCYDKTRFSIIAGVNATDSGYNTSPAYGSIDGSPTTFKGHTILFLIFNTSGSTLTLRLGTPNLAAGLVNFIVVNGVKYTGFSYSTDGATRTAWQAVNGAGSAFTSGVRYDVMVG